MNNFNLSEESKKLFRNCIEKYKEEFDKEIIYRKYKWECLKIFQDNWNIEAKNFKEMIDKSIPKIKNGNDDFLNIKPYNLNGYCLKDTVIKLMNTGKNVIGFFKDLYDENIYLEDRFKNFKKNFVFKLEDGRNAFMDVRIFSVLLALRYPKNYFMYQYDVKKCVRKEINISNKIKKEFEGFCEGLCIFNELRKIVFNDKELLKKFDNYVNENKDMYNDDNYCFLIQDICWSIRNWNKKEI